MTNCNYLANLADGVIDNKIVEWIRNRNERETCCPCCGEKVVFDDMWMNMNRMPGTDYYFVKCDDCDCSFWIDEQGNPKYYYDNEKIADISDDEKEVSIDYYEDDEIEKEKARFEKEKATNSFEYNSSEHIGF